MQIVINGAANVRSLSYQTYQPHGFTSTNHHVGPHCKHEKRWGIIFECLVSKCVHFYLLCSMATIFFSFLCDVFWEEEGNHVKTFVTMALIPLEVKDSSKKPFLHLRLLKKQLAEQSINLLLDLGGTREREIKSVQFSWKTKQSKEKSWWEF